MPQEKDTKINHSNIYSIPGNVTFSSRDELNRKNIADNLHRLLTSKNFPSPFLLDGPWGIGKSEFCYKLINEIKNKNKLNLTIIPIYINVFSAERINNPFLVMMAAIQGTIQPTIDLEKNDKTALTKIIEKGVKIANKELHLEKLIPAIAIDLIKSMTTIDPGETIKELSNQLSTSEEKDIFIKSLENIYELDKDYQEFQTALSEFATNENPILFVIDELDRCQPDFAIKFLEKIKYLFDVPNVYFIFSCDSSQLLSTINHSYGYKLEAETYLEKFFSSKCYLTINDKLQTNSKLVTRLTEILKENKEINDQDLQGVTAVLNSISSIYSIRRLEKTINFIITLGSGKFESLVVSIQTPTTSGQSPFILKFYHLLTLIDIFLYKSSYTSKILQGAISDDEFKRVIDSSIFKQTLNLHDSLIHTGTLKKDFTIEEEKRDFIYDKHQSMKIIRFFNTFGDISSLH